MMGHAFGVIHESATTLAEAEDRAMPQSLAQIYVHLIFSTKERQPLLWDGAFRQRTHAYLAGVCKHQDSPAVVIGGVADHVHILSRLGRTIDVATLVRELKRDSSKWIKETDPKLRAFHWQAGYGAFSVSPSHVDALVRYIKDQPEHHRVVTFQEEFRRICKKYGLEIDERYAWD
jgi:REP element-mobilizing transposase RayT